MKDSNLIIKCIKIQISWVFSSQIKQLYFLIPLSNQGLKFEFRFQNMPDSLSPMPNQGLKFEFRFQKIPDSLSPMSNQGLKFEFRFQKMPDSSSPLSN